MGTLHFGRFRMSHYRTSLQSLWVVLGLVPVFLAITGVIMWWNRVLSPALRSLSKSSTDTALGILPEEQS